MNGRIVARLGLFSAAIGRGPSTPDKLTSVIAIALGILFVFFAFSPETRLGQRKTPGVPIGSAGRLILFIIAIVMFTVGIQGLFH